MRLPNQPFFKTRSQRGFTLIEMLVTVAVLVILAGSGMAAFINFNDKQKVMTAARDLQAFMRTAQGKAQVRETPSSCAPGTNFPLQAYRVSAPLGAGQTVSMHANCGQFPNPSRNTLRDTMKMPAGVSVRMTPPEDTPLNMRFFVLFGGVRFVSTNPNTAKTIVVSGWNNTYTFVVSPGGEISEGCWEGTC
jgi:prepilin-type N-terminal cleavage/methylation domain-containing protein